MVEPKDIKIGDWLYIDSEAYIEHGEDDIVGGLAKVIRIEGDSVEFEGEGGIKGAMYNLTSLLPRQEEWKARFGEQRAHASPDPRPAFNQML